MEPATNQARVALITGGSGGIGLAVAQALARQGGWQIHILDVKEAEGKAAAAALPDTTFHRADLTQYDEIAAAFKAAYLAGGGEGRLDFVFANAGIIEKGYMLDQTSDASLDPPPRPDHAAIAVNLQGAIDTVHIARHFMRRSPEREKGAIVVTGSCSSVWPTYWAPVYSASKFGILGFTRAVAGHCKVVDGIRVNALLPGAVKTPIVPDWGDFPDDTFTPLELISEVVLRLAAGQEIIDSKGQTVPPEKAYGQAIIVTGKNIYIQPEPEYCDEVMAKTIDATKAESRYA